MAIPWIRLIRSVPWQQVAKKAPEIADLAKQLWNATYNKTPAEIDVSSNQDLQSREARQLQNLSADQRIALLDDKLNSLEASYARLHGQLTEALELITNLAEQNTQLVKTIDTNRLHIKRLTIAAVFFALILGLSLYFSLR